MNFPQVLLGAIDVTDDTKMMSKALIEEMAASSESITSIMESKHGRTVGKEINITLPIPEYEKGEPLEL